MKPYYERDGITIFHGDCREILPHVKADCVVTDPPYGIGENHKRVASRGKLAACTDYGAFDWDRHPPARELIDACVAAAPQAVLWGGNYFHLPPSPCWLVWDKQNGANDFADCELAWTNLKGAVRIIRHLWNGMIRKDGEARFHPTQKPLGVMRWALSFTEGAVLDPFMGSGTTLVAAKLEGRRAIGIEIEERYAEIAAKRLAQGILAFDGVHEQRGGASGLGEVPGHQASLRLEGV